MSELLVDVHGLRTFRVSDDGQLLPVIALDDSWRGGTCIARCRRDPGHQAPVDQCRCGIYTFRNLRVLREQYQQADLLVAVVALEGQTLAGSRGWRSQAARVLAIWVSPDALPDGLLAGLMTNLPEVAFHVDVDQMVSNYSDLVSASPGGSAALAAVQRPPGPRAVQPGRVPLYLLATALFTVAFVVATHRPTGFSDVADLGHFLGSNFQHLVFPVLILGLWVRNRRLRGTAASLITALLRVGIPLLLGAGFAQLISRGNIAIDPIFAVYFVFLTWLEVWQFAASVGRTDGISGVMARHLLHVGRNAWRLLRPSRRNTGVNFVSYLTHPIAGYPLIQPVHFEKPPR